MSHFIARLVASRWTVPVSALLACAALAVSTLTLVSYSADQDRANRQRQFELCVEANQIRAASVDANRATESLIRSILAVVLRPGEGDAERQLAVQEVYKNFRPAFDQYDGVLERLGDPRDCRTIKENR